MAEVLAITGGLAAALQLSSCAKKFATALYRFSLDAGAASREVERFANQVRSFSDTVGLAHGTLSHFCKENPKSPAVVYISSNDVLKNIGKEALAVRTHLRQIQHQVIGLRSSVALWASVKWTFKKSSILELSPEMESVKTSLSLVMATAQFEAAAAHYKDDADGLREQLRMLKRVIKGHLKTMKHLRSQLYRANSPSHQADDTEPHQPPLFDPTMHDALIKLGRSMYRRGVVPDSPHTSPSASQDSLRAPPTPLDGQNQLHVSRSATARRRTPRPTSSYSRRESPTYYIFQSESFDPPRPRRPPPPPTPHPLTRPSESSVRPQQLSNILRFNRDQDVDAGIDGWNGSSWGKFRRVTALLVQTLDVNIISMSTARELSLDIKRLGPTEGIMFDFGTGRPERSVGKAVLRWNRSQFDYDYARYPPLTVVCDVCENSEIGLVLGRPFVEERELRWPTTSAK